MDSTPERRIEQLTAELAETRLALDCCKESLQLARSALCAVADGLAITDLQGRISCLNPVAVHMTGWKEDEALGRPLADIVRFTDARGRLVDVLDEGFSNSRDEEIISLRRRDGHVILVDGAIAKVHDPHRRPIANVVTFRNVTAATRLTRELNFHAHHDPLTGLHNRRAFESHLRRAIGTAADQGCRHCLLYFDLDRFKHVNDAAGHSAGDELLRQLALLLRRQLRDHDSIARIGGDEFTVLLENCPVERAAQVAEKLRAAIADLEFAWDARVFRVGSSIGVVEFGDGGLSPAQVMSLADRMCYAAKDRGRDQVAIHHGPGQSGTGSEPHRAAPVAEADLAAASR